MSYADTLQERSAQHKAELSAIERERMVSRHKKHGIACEENRHLMWIEFTERISNMEAK